MHSTDSVHNGRTSGKSSHKHSTTESDDTLSKHIVSEYSTSSSDSNMYYVHNNGTDPKASKAYHQTRMAGTLADLDKQFSSNPPRRPS